MKLFITKSKRKNKKYDLLDENKKYILSCWDNRFSDYTMHKDPDRRERYLLRHKKMRIGTKAEYILLAFGVSIYYGVNQHWRHQFVMLIKDLILI